MEYVLVIVLWSGITGSKQTTSITNIAGFKSKEVCDIAAQDTRILILNRYVEIKTRCIKIK